ncbi:hypothetical protein GQ42DRAFT_161663 [Ramicandelaber brevisporus]|nr:hypothetical protein GQ42DRAFT_161663 [Ramicandelaber brevisporus]
MVELSEITALRKQYMTELVQIRQTHNRLKELERQYELQDPQAAAKGLISSPASRQDRRNEMKDVERQLASMSINDNDGSGGTNRIVADGLAPLQDPTAAAELRKQFRGLARAIRHFAPPASYEMVAIGNLRHMPTFKLRDIFRTNGIQTEFIPGIHAVGASATQMYEFVIASNYIEVFMEAMLAIRAIVISDYDPLAPEHVHPTRKGKVLNDEQRRARAVVKYTKRLSVAHNGARTAPYRKFLVEQAQRYEITLNPTAKPKTKKKNKDRFGDEGYGSVQPRSRGGYNGSRGGGGDAYLRKIATTVQEEVVGWQGYQKGGQNFADWE